LMAQRGSGARFMAGAWVFPGGVVDEIDAGDRAAAALAGSVGDEHRPWVAAALRELVEEAQVWVTAEPVILDEPDTWLRDEAVFEAAIERGLHFDTDRVAYFANWITPTMVPLRFDTRFFAVEVGSDTRAFAEPGELDAVAWVTPHDALAKGRSGEWVVPFPTMKTLEFLAEEYEAIWKRAVAATGSDPVAAAAGRLISGRTRWMYFTMICWRVAMNAWVNDVTAFD